MFPPGGRQVRHTEVFVCLTLCVCFVVKRTTWSLLITMWVFCDNCIVTLTTVISIHPPIHPSIHQSIHSSIHQSIHLSVHKSIHPSNYKPTHVPTSLSPFMFVCVSLYPPFSLSLSLYPHFFRTSFFPNLFIYLFTYNYLLRSPLTSRYSSQCQGRNPLLLMHYFSLHFCLHIQSPI
jgi:hypothetical protein